MPTTYVFFVEHSSNAGREYDNTTPVVRAGRYRDYGGDVPLADGITARLIEAEAALKAGNASWLTILNDLRTQVSALMTARYGSLLGYPQSTNTLPPLTDPGTDAARVNLLFRERAFWLYLTGTRLGDMRRLIRNYAFSTRIIGPLAYARRSRARKSLTPVRISSSRCPKLPRKATMESRP